MNLPASSKQKGSTNRERIRMDSKELQRTSRPGTSCVQKAVLNWLCRIARDTQEPVAQRRLDCAEEVKANNCSLTVCDTTDTVLCMYVCGVTRTHY